MRSRSTSWVLAMARGVVVNFDLGERFPRPRSQQRGSLRGCGSGSGGITPEFFFEIFDAKSRVWGGNLGQKTDRGST